jgi:hypothetical protein
MIKGKREWLIIEFADEPDDCSCRNILGYLLQFIAERPKMSLQESALMAVTDDNIWVWHY